MKHDGERLVQTRIDIPYVPASLKDKSYEASNIGSLFNSASNNFKDRHRFNSSLGLVDAVLGNSTVLFLKENSTSSQMEYLGAVSYEGCRADSLYPSSSDQFVYVLFESCPPLKITISQHLNATWLMHPSYAGKKVLITEGQDFFGDISTFSIHVDTDVNEIVFLDRYFDPQSVSSIESCQTFLDVFLLRATSSDSTLDVIIQCLDRSGNQLRYIAAYDAYYQETSRVSAVGEARGTPLSSEDGEYLAITLHDDVSTDYNLVLYEVSNLDRTPLRVRYRDPIKVKFLHLSNLTYLAVYRVGVNVELVNVDSLFSTRDLNQALISVPGTTVMCDTACTSVDVVAEDYVMIFNQAMQQYDVTYAELGSGDSSPEFVKIPNVSNRPAILSFLQAPPTPAPPPTTHPTTPTAESTATDNTSTTNSPSGLTTGAISGIVVGISAILVILVMILVAVCLRRLKKWLQRCRQRSEEPSIEVVPPDPADMVPEVRVVLPQEEDPMQPQDVVRENDGELVGPENHLQPHPVTQETGEGDGGYSSSTYSSPRASPRGERYQQCTDNSSLGSSSDGSIVSHNYVVLFGNPHPPSQ